MVKPWERKPEQKQDGFRDGVKKEDIVDKDKVNRAEVMNSLTDEDVRLIKIRKDIEGKNFVDDYALKCLVRSDHYYQQYISTLTTIDALLFKIVNAKAELDRNNVDVSVNSTIKCYAGTNIKMDIRDIKNHNIMLRREFIESIKGIWVMLAELYRYVDQLRIDKVSIMSVADYRNRVEQIKAILNENGVDLFMEVK